MQKFFTKSQSLVDHIRTDKTVPIGKSEVTQTAIDEKKEETLTKQQLVNAKWQALACAMILYHTYNIKPNQINEWVECATKNILGRHLGGLKSFIHMQRCIEVYNRNPVTAPLPTSDEKLLEMVASWTVDAYWSKYNEEWYKVFGE